jgi:hypothetical protein
VLVVEPTAQSLSVQTIRGYEKARYQIKVVGNKIETEEENLLKQCERRLPWFFTIHKRNEVLKKGWVYLHISTETKPVMDSIKRTIDSTQKNWIKFYNDLVALHKKHAESWLNDSFQTKFEDQIDPTFDPEAFFAR